MDCRLTGIFLLIALFVTTSASFGGKEHVHIKVHVPHIINELHHEKKVILVHHPHEDHHHHEHVVYDHGHHGHHGHGYGGYKGGHGGGEVIIEDAGHGHYGGVSSYGVSSAGYGGSYGGGYGGHSGGHSGGGFSSYGGHAPGHYVGSYEPDHHDSHYHR